MSQNNKLHLLLYGIGLLSSNHVIKFIQSDCRLTNFTIKWVSNVLIRPEDILFKPYVVSCCFLELWHNLSHTYALSIIKLNTEAIVQYLTYLIKSIGPWYEPVHINCIGLFLSVIMKFKFSAISLIYWQIGTVEALGKEMLDHCIPTNCHKSDVYDL